jgi:hypothetical protein
MKIIVCCSLLHILYEIMYRLILKIKKVINNSRGKYKRNECLINACKSDEDLSSFTWTSAMIFSA